MGWDFDGLVVHEGFGRVSLVEGWFSFGFDVARLSRGLIIQLLLKPEDGSITF